MFEKALKVKPALLAAAALALGLSGAAGAQTKITFAGAMPTTAADSRANVAYFKKVEEQSGGKLKFESTFDGQVLSYRGSLSGIKDGLADAGQFFPAFFLSEMKAQNTVVTLGGLATDAWSHVGASNETVLLNCAECNAEFARFKLKPLLTAGSAPFLVMCRSPITDLAQLKGKNIRAVGPAQALALELGGTPVSTPPSEIFEALQRGQVECAVGSVDWLKQYGLADVIKFVFAMPTGYDTGGRMPLTFNTDVWKKFSAEQRQVVVRNLPFMVAEATANNLSDGREAQRYAEAKGAVFGALPAYTQLLERGRLVEADRALASAQQRKVTDGAAIVKTYQEKLVKWQKIVADTGGDRTKFEEALWTEVFSKLK